MLVYDQINTFESNFIELEFESFDFDSILYQTSLSCIFLQLYQFMRLLLILLDFQDFYRD